MDAIAYWPAALMIFGALMIVVINDWQKRRLVEQAWKKGDRPKRKYLNNQTDWRQIVFMIVGVLVFAAAPLYWSTLAPESRQVLVEVGKWTNLVVPIVVGIAILLVLAFVLLTAYANFRLRSQPWHRDLSQVYKLRLEGRYAEAIAMAQHVLSEPGIAAGSAVHQITRCHLAILEGMRGDWRQALTIIEQLEAASDSPPGFGVTKGVILWQLGQLDAAEIELRESVRTNPDRSIGLAALGLFLVGIGHVEEAIILLRTLDCKLAEKSASKEVKGMTEQLRQATNASRDIGPAVTPTEFDAAIHQLLAFSMEGIVFRDRKTKRSDSPRAAT